MLRGMTTAGFIAPMLATPQADFTFDPESLLSEMPNADRDFDVIARELGR